MAANDGMPAEGAPPCWRDDAPLDSSCVENRPRTTQLIWTLVQIAAIWTISDIGYYFLLPVLDVQPSYNAGPIAVSLYYAFWVGIAVITFWPLYRTWSLYGRWTTFENRLTSYIVWSVSFSGCILFAAYLIPLLPSVNWKESWSPPEVVLATPWYFLPKSIDILFQQLLVVALVLALAAQRYSVGKISVYSAACFGAIHALLAFGGVPAGYVIRFMISAMIFGLAFPYLLLRVRNGFAYSYVVHWLYYAVSVLLPHVFLSSAK
jgi:hypothetical protein